MRSSNTTTPSKKEGSLQVRNGRHPRRGCNSVAERASTNQLLDHFSHLESPESLTTHELLVALRANVDQLHKQLVNGKGAHKSVSTVKENPTLLFRHSVGYKWRRVGVLKRDSLPFNELTNYRHSHQREYQYIVLPQSIRPVDVRKCEYAIADKPHNPDILSWDRKLNGASGYYEELPVIRLTIRALCVWQWIAESCLVKEIAARWKTTNKTVEYHRANLYRALRPWGAYDIAGLTRLAIKLGLIVV